MPKEPDEKPIEYVYFEDEFIPKGIIALEYTVPQINDGVGLNAYTRLLFLSGKLDKNDIGYPFSHFKQKYEDIVNKLNLDESKTAIENSSIELISELKEWDKLVKNRLLGAFTVYSYTDIDLLFSYNDAFVEKQSANLDGSPYVKYKGIIRKKPIVPNIADYLVMLKNNKHLIHDLINLNAGVESWKLYESKVLVESLAVRIIDNLPLLPEKFDRDLELALEKTKKVQIYGANDKPFDLNINFGAIRAVRNLGKSLLSLPELVVGDLLKEKVNDALGTYEKFALDRIQPRSIDLVLNLGRSALLVPYGCNDENILKMALYEQKATEKPIVVIEDIKEKRRKLKEEREAAEAEKRLQAKEHDAPLLATLNSIAEQHNNIFSQYKVKNAKEARRIGLTGGDGSLVSKMFELGIVENADKKEYEQLALDLYCLINLAASLKMQNAENLHQELENLLLESEQLRDQYFEFLKSNKLLTFAKPIELNGSLKSNIVTIKDSWNLLIKAMDKSDFSVGDEDLDAVREMLEIIYKNTEVIEDQQDISTQQDQDYEAQDIFSETKEPEATQNSVEFDISNYRRLVDQLSEQLSVEIFPPETTYQQLLEDLQKQIDNEENDINIDMIEQQRMKTLYELMIKYKGRILRSDDKNRPLLKGLYYIMIFELDNDVYAVAENPLYKNATYITRKSLTPLLETESIVSIHLNSKLLARNLGSVQLIHAPEDKVGVTHKQRIEITIIELKER